MQDGERKPPEMKNLFGHLTRRPRLNATVSKQRKVSTTMSHVTYTVRAEHDGGWAYKVGDVFSESFPTHEAAHAAAARAAQEQRAPGQGGPIQYEDSFRAMARGARKAAMTGRAPTSRIRAGSIHVAS